VSDEPIDDPEVGAVQDPTLSKKRARRLRHHISVTESESMASGEEDPDLSKATRASRESMTPEDKAEEREMKKALTASQQSSARHQLLFKVAEQEHVKKAKRISSGQEEEPTTSSTSSSSSGSASVLRAAEIPGVFRVVRPVVLGLPRLLPKRKVPWTPSSPTAPKPLPAAPKPMALQVFERPLGPSSIGEAVVLPSDTDDSQGVEIMPQAETVTEVVEIEDSQSQHT
jgi:hypothetical protein